MRNVSWLSGFLLSNFSFMGKTCFNKFETLTHSHPEKEIERDYEEEREGFPVPTIPLLRFIIVRMLAG